MKIFNIRTTKISAKGILKSITDKGFVFENDEGEELLEFEVIKQYFENSEVKLDIVKTNKVEEGL